MAKIYHVMDELDERSQGKEDYDHILEKAFKEGYEHGFRKAMKEAEGFDEKSKVHHYKEGFEQKIEKLKERY